LQPGDHFFSPAWGKCVQEKGSGGAAILAVVIVVGNLNAIWLSLYNISEPGAANAVWTYQLPRSLQDPFAVYGIVFWLWVVVDAFIIVNGRKDKEDIAHEL
jgi:hypothetical protein